jgi:hypothetical protein
MSKLNVCFQIRQYTLATAIILAPVCFAVANPSLVRQNVVTPQLAPVIPSVDLAFDATQMNAEIVKLEPIVRNLGRTTSAGGEVFCSVETATVGASGPNAALLNKRWNLPAIAPGQSHRLLPGMGEPGIVDAKCFISRVNGEKNESNNNWRWQKPASARSAAMPSAAGLTANVVPRETLQAIPDLAFDDAKIVAEIQNMAMTIKNVGAVASSGGTLGCDADTQSYLNQREEQARRRGATTGTPTFGGPIPPIAAGQSVRVLVGPWSSFRAPVADLIELNCTIYSVSGERNTANNRFQWKKASLVSASDLTAEHSFAPAPDLTFELTNPAAAKQYLPNHFTIKNIGAAASRPTRYECQFSIQGERPETSINGVTGFEIPVIAAGSSWRSPADNSPTSSVTKSATWSCTIDPDRNSGDRKIANNKKVFVWEPALIYPYFPK